MAAKVVVGISELSRKLQALPKRVERNILRSASTAGAGLLRDEVRRRAPVDTGLLRKSVRSERRRASRPDEVRAVVSIKSKAGGGKNAQNYWHVQEYGSVHQPARPFVRPSVESEQEAAFDVIRQHIQARIHKEAKDA